MPRIRMNVAGTMKIVEKRGSPGLPPNLGNTELQSLGGSPASASVGETFVVSH